MGLDVYRVCKAFLKKGHMAFSKAAAAASGESSSGCGACKACL